MATTEAKSRSQLTDLPILPTVLVELLSIPLDDEHYFEKIEKLAERDPPLALKIIQLSNTAKQAKVKPIRSIKDAIVRMGSKQLFNLINLVALTRVYVPSSDFERTLWQQALMSAEILKTTYDVLLRSVINADMAYLVGLLHDIEITLNHKHYQKDFENIEDLSCFLPKPYVKSRIAYLLREHAFNGAKICKHWQIPSPIPEIIYFHHHDHLPEKFKKFEPLIETIRRVQFADLVTAYFQKNRNLDLTAITNLLAQSEIMYEWQQRNTHFNELLDALPDAVDIAKEKYALLNL